MYNPKKNLHKLVQKIRNYNEGININWELTTLDIRRAKQILSSSEDITVHYHGQSVWIDSCDDQGNTCTVHMRGNEREKSDVAVSELEEV